VFEATGISSCLLRGKIGNESKASAQNSPEFSDDSNLARRDQKLSPQSCGDLANECNNLWSFGAFQQAHHFHFERCKQIYKSLVALVDHIHS
jgi:hypothetical protein